MLKNTILKRFERPIIILMMFPILSSLFLFLKDMKWWIKSPQLVTIYIQSWIKKQLYFSTSRFHYESGQIQTEPGQLTYSETPIGTFLSLISPYIIQCNTYIEWGSGMGQLCMSQWHCFKKPFRGIEIIPVLNKISRTFLNPSVDGEFINASFLTNELPNDIHLIYFTATCFSTDFIARLRPILMNLKSGSIVIIIGKELPFPELRLLNKERCLFAWGVDEARIYTKR